MMAAARSFWTLMCGNILYTATAVVSGAPYTTVYTRVPLRQRGLYNRSAAAPASPSVDVKVILTLPCTFCIEKYE